MVLYWKDFGFLVEMADRGFFGGTSTDAEGLVLEDFEFVNVIFGGVGKPDRTGIGGNRTEEGVGDYVGHFYEYGRQRKEVAPTQYLHPHNRKQQRGDRGTKIQKEPIPTTNHHHHQSGFSNCQTMSIPQLIGVFN